MIRSYPKPVELPEAPFGKGALVSNESAPRGNRRRSTSATPFNGGSTEKW